MRAFPSSYHHTITCTEHINDQQVPSLLGNFGDHAQSSRVQHSTPVESDALTN